MTPRSSTDVQHAISTSNTNIDSIIFVHGLNGDRINTFSTAQPDGQRYLWIENDLPQTLHSRNIRCRIFSYGYNAATHTGRLSLQDLWDHGEQLLSTVTDKRLLDGTSERPIVWMTHSLGGLVVKSALHRSYLATPGDSPNLRSLALSTHAIFFFGVPHQGGAAGTVSVGEIALNIVGAFRATNTRIVEILEPGNQALKAHFESYKTISHLYYQRSFWEMYPTPVKLGHREIKSLLIVPKESAIPPGQKNDQPTALHKDHLGLVKFASSDDPDYATVVSALVIELEKSFRLVRDRWTEWKRTLRTHEHKTSYLPTNWPFPPNNHFQGRQEELSKLKQLLQTHDRQRVVTVDGVAGVGKTSLSLRYGYEALASHSAILWIPASSKRSVEDAYQWVLGRIVEVLSQDAPGGNIDFDSVARQLNIQGLLNSDGKLSIPDDSPELRLKAVTSVLNWLQRQSDHSWLIIFDNHDDLTFRLRDFFPKCDWGSYLITSRRPEIHDYGTDSLSLRGLSSPDSKSLLLRGVERDASVEEVDAMAQHIVELVDYHPLAIEQASAYLRRRPHVPMAQYIERFKRKERETRPRELLQNNENLWPDYPWTCMTTFEISREEMDLENPNALQVLQHCAWLDRDDILVEFLCSHAKEIGDRITEEDVDNLVTILYSYAFILPKVGRGSFAIHAVIHVWSRERLGLEEQTTSMLRSFKSLIHSPYQTTGGGEILPISNDDFRLQRSAVHHIEYALEIGDEIIGYWPLRASVGEVTPSTTATSASVLECLDSAFRGVEGLPDYPEPSHQRTYPSTIRTKNAKTSDTLLQNTWNIVATVSSIAYEQGQYKLSLRFQLRSLAFILTFQPVDFDRLMAPDKYFDQILLSLMLIIAYLQQRGRHTAASQILTFLQSTFVPTAPVQQSLKGQVEILARRNQQEAVPGGIQQHRAIDGVEELEEVLGALRFLRHSKGPDDDGEEMHMTLEAIKIVANGYFEREDYEGAEMLYEALMNKRCEGLPNGEVEYVQACFDYGNCLRLAGGVHNDPKKLEQAVKLITEALTGFVKHVGEHDARTLWAMTSLGSTLIYQRKFHEAEEQLSRGMVLAKMVDGNPVDKLMCQDKLAEARLALVTGTGAGSTGTTRIAIAEATARHCLSGMLTFFPLENPRCLRLIVSWAKCLRLLGCRNCVVLSFVLLRYVLECKVACGVVDRMFKAALVEMGALVSGHISIKGLSDADREGIQREKRRYGIVLLESMGMMVVPQDRAAEFGRELVMSSEGNDDDDEVLSHADSLD